MTLASGDLTTLSAVKSYMSTTSLPGDDVIKRLITATSFQILGYLNRGVVIPKTYSEQVDGSGTRSVVLANWPLLSLTSLVASGVSFSEANQASSEMVFSNPYGWRAGPTWNGIPPGDMAVVELVGGGTFTYGRQNIVVSYRAGYRVTGEVPNAVSYTPAAPYGQWATDEGVTYTSSGTALVRISAGSPGVGQYLAPNPDLTTPVLPYTFNILDVTAGLSINYGFVPFVLEQATIDTISERAAYRGRLGIKSRNLASQESISFDTSGLTDYTRLMLAPYRSVIPSAVGIGA